MHLKPGRECVSTGAEGAQTRRSLVHHLLHPQILMLLVLLAPADFEAQSSLLQKRLHPQIQISNACPAGLVRGTFEGMGYFWKFKNGKG